MQCSQCLTQPACHIRAKSITWLNKMDAQSQLIRLVFVLGEHPLAAHNNRIGNRKRRLASGITALRSKGLFVILSATPHARRHCRCRFFQVLCSMKSPIPARAPIAALNLDLIGEIGF